MMKLKQILPKDILGDDAFLAVRQNKRQEMISLKKDRRVALGDFIMLHFENFTTLWWQVQEMLRIEKGGAAQIQDELAAYNPLVPQGHELVATLMIEIDDPVIRRKTLQELTHIERCIALRFGEHRIIATAEEEDTARTSESGKTSAVHFLRWTFSEAQIADFTKPQTDVIVEVVHPAYTSKTLLAESTRQALSSDLT
ncbi:MAG: DUF3501 family protein [Alphaproteobacteria bacterium]